MIDAKDQLQVIQRLEYFQTPLIQKYFAENYITMGNNNTDKIIYIYENGKPNIILPNDLLYKHLLELKFNIPSMNNIINTLLKLKFPLLKLNGLKFSTANHFNYSVYTNTISLDATEYDMREFCDKTLRYNKLSEKRKVN